MIARKSVPLAVIAALSAAPVLKLGDVQAVELFEAAWLCLALPVFVYGGLKIPVGGLWRRYGGRYFVFLLLCLAVSLLSLRLPFYPPPGFSMLKRPFILSLSRILEFSLAVYFMILIAGMLQRSRSLFRFILDAYIAAGILSACVSLAAFALLTVAGVATFPVYGPDQRVRGFFNEGGPYGIFLVSVMVVALLRARIFPLIYPFLHKIALLLLGVALFLSGSKAGLLAVAALAGIGLLAAGSRAQRAALLSACAVVLAAFLVLFQGKMAGYAYAYLNFEESVAYRPDDPNLIMGRITGAMIVPRMVAAHPLLGIGVGNYSLMRNDPDYLEGLPAVDDWDLAGMGLIGATAEFGIPLALLFSALLFRPLLVARKRGAPTTLAVAAGFQPLAFLLGVNLNMFYPWLVAAFVLALEPHEPVISP